MRLLVVLGVVVMLVLAGCNAPGVTTPSPSPGPGNASPGTPTPSPSSPGESMTSPTRTPTEPQGTDAAAGSLADPDTDVLGWENGYWYNESITVDRSNGLNATELNATVARSMARVEEIRRLEFTRTVPVDVISRSEFRERNADQYSAIGDRFRTHQNAKFEALFFVNESTDAVATQRRTRGATVLGYYNYAKDKIVIVSENESTPRIDEITLSQELFHALQDQYFNLSSDTLTGVTVEGQNAVNAVVEGDGNYVDYLYGQRCDAEWDCLRPQSENSGGGGSGANIGIQVLKLPGYTEGVEFVQRVKQRGGWDAVNALYRNPPNSTEQYIHPEKYPDEPVAPARITDESSSEWRVLKLGDGSVNYARFGEAGVFTMFWYASYEETLRRQARSTVVIPYGALFVPSDSGQGLAEPNPYNYSHPVTAGFAGDRFLPYVSDSTPQNETGYVWRLEWDTPQDAREFAAAYRELLKYHGAERVGEDTYVIRGGEFNDAFRVTVTDSSVVIVNAPTRSDLDEIKPQ